LCGEEITAENYENYAKTFCAATCLFVLIVPVWGGSGFHFNDKFQIKLGKNMLILEARSFKDGKWVTRFPSIIGHSLNFVLMKQLLVVHFKNRAGDKMIIQYSNKSFNTSGNDISRLMDLMRGVIDKKKGITNIDVTVQHETLCNCCNKEWFLPRYSHINMCDDCSDMLD